MVKLPWYFMFAFIVCWPAAVLPAPVFTATADGATVTLTDEPCTIRAVSNLRYRATWEEKGKVFEGCWSANPRVGVVSAYFVEDRTVVAIPIPMFERVTGI